MHVAIRSGPGSHAWETKGTAEHLLVREDGGSDSGTNIAADCRRCNLGRHRRPNRPPTPEQYRALVQTRMSRHRWHGPWVFKSPTRSGPRAGLGHHRDRADR